MDTRHMTYPDCAFVLIILGWVLPYTEQPEALAREVERVLAVDGYRVVGTDTIVSAEEADAGVARGAGFCSLAGFAELWPTLTFVHREETVLPVTHLSQWRR
jgi:hypothetical protein